MIDLSVIIVNYNVKYFLAQCLQSVQRASEGLEVEVIVVDNNSKDGSQTLLKEQFGEEIIFIENHDNPGFSKANNQGIAIAKGRYVVLLNPDTLVAEDTFRVCLEFMDARPKAGGLGIKMIDGTGRFLPESKRALPTPWVSFYKIFGLARLFPKSKRFGKYHLSYLSKEENHEIEILSGAFMWMRKSVLEEIDYLDEDFFMYGEDIDLSYRITKAGYQNFYVADSQIIHYKGESTKTGSLNYVKVFYQAMIIFAQKHFGGRQKQGFIAGIKLAVYFRALLAVLYRLGKRFGFALLEALMVLGIIQGIKAYWEHYVKYIEGGEYPWAFDWVAAPIYTLVFIGFLSLAGAYKKPFRIRPLITATLGAFIGIATVSYIFPQINYSRAIVGLSSIFTMILTIGTRGIWSLRHHGNFFFTEPQRKKVLIISPTHLLKDIAKLIRTRLDYPVEVIGTLYTESSVEPEPSILPVLGGINELEMVCRLYGVEEIIIANQDFSTRSLISVVERLFGWEIGVKILPPYSSYIIGPNSTYSEERLLSPDFRLMQARFRRSKRLFNVAASMLLLLLFPLTFWAYHHPLSAIRELWKVLFKRAELVGYSQHEPEGLPPLKPASLSLIDRIETPSSAIKSRASALDAYYARMYSWYLDVEIAIRAWRRIGAKIHDH